MQTRVKPVTQAQEIGGSEADKPNVMRKPKNREKDTEVP